mmetsp:Transcript_47209/g.110387  ORF Transcript_47209/g.110387 Transcript_47209/m.110387 type:complete len:663 (-) Transcript_47209:71-2059(-)
MEQLSPGVELQAKAEDGKYYVAKVLQISAKRRRAPVKVQYKGYEGEFWLPLSDLRSKLLSTGQSPAVKVDLTVLSKGMELQALAVDGSLYKAEVVRVDLKNHPKAPVKVRYVGYTAASDEWLGPDRLRSKLLKPGAKAKTTEQRPKKTSSKVEAVSDIGIIGSGVMGSNLGLNIADKTHGGKPFEVSLYDLSNEQVQSVLSANSSYKNLHGFGGKEKLKDFVASLKRPRKAIMLVPAGKATDAVIEDLAALFQKDDIIIDVGNANFRDQIRRAESLEKRGLRFLGMGVSGGAEGARKGPAFFPGGTLSVWNDVKHIVEAAAAKAADGRPCATMNGKGGAGSCVKMFHNAGEYAVLQIWGEVHEVLKAYGVDGDVQAKLLESWKVKTGGRYAGLLDSYMLDITVEVVKAKDSAIAGGQEDGSPLLSRTMDKTDSKGTGLWSVVEALQAAVPAPSLAAALLARQMSMVRPERLENAAAVPLPTPSDKGSWSAEMEEDLFWATAFAIIASYAQMFQCLRKMDEVFEFGLQLPATIATFRAGCILQGFLLEPMTKAFEENPKLPNLLSAFKPEIQDNLHRFKRILGKVTKETGVTVPCFYASLDYIQTMYLTEIPSAQCVSLQRDVFGRHGFERLDKEGRFNAEWRSLQQGEAAITSATSAVTSQK